MRAPALPLLLASCVAILAIAEPALAREKERGRGRGWDRGAPRRVDPARELERFAEDALRRMQDEALREAAPPVQRTTRPRRTTASPPRSAPEPVRAAQPAEVAEPVAPEPAPAPVVVAPAPIAPPAAPTSRFGLAAALLALLGVALAWLLRRRRANDADAPAPIRSLAVEAVAQQALLAADASPAAAASGGRYEILGELGRGGMGVVYKARDTRLDRVIAMKRLPDPLRNEPRYVELLLREARSAARLNHRNIVTVYDVDREAEGWFITMELLEGASLAAILASRKRMTPRTAVAIGAQALAGLGFAHDKGIVHRDVKPANLFLERDRTLKLMDFGVAKILEEARRKQTIIGGTPAYMAPEQSSGGVIDGRADLYALGATLFELLTGAAPFATGEPQGARATAPAPDPRTLVADLPAPLAELVMALLAPSPDARPASAAEALRRLNEIGTALGVPKL
ncbi:MAG: serine/threonine protein kinase [Myxococcota bacterium]|jgi:serine/threonine-protein kinase|nr:serine/threonine protein kinase [Myxococcota bacterium]